MKKKQTFFITGGHLTPALAVIKELERRGVEKVVWIGRKKTMKGDKKFSAEYRIVSEKLDIPFENLTTGKLIRPWNIKSFIDAIISFLKIPIGFIQTIYLTIKHKPTVIISFGGYLAVPVVIVGWIFGIPSVTHEQTVVTGVANRIIGKFARKVLISWKNSEKFFNKNKTIFTGNPIRNEVLNTTTDVFSINEDLRTIYITGGNQGSHIINNNIFKIIEILLQDYNVIHQTGTSTVTKDLNKAKRIKSKLEGKTKGKYLVAGNIYGKKIGEVFAKSDLIISRSGANICFEILALGKMSILIPIPWSLKNEQQKNANVLAELGIATIIKEESFNHEVLLSNIKRAMSLVNKKKAFNNKILDTVKDEAAKHIKLNADKKIVDEIEKVVN